MPRPHAIRLHDAYLKLDFRFHPGVHQDVRREELFQRLVQHHLLASNMYTLQDWLELPQQQESTYAFLQAYAKQLWPGKAGERGHLANPDLGKQTRSFVGAIDMHWKRARGGQKVKDVGLGVQSYIGSVALSCIGRAFERYVGVLLEPALTGANMEDVKALIGGITSTMIGPPISALVVQQVVTEDEDDEEIEGFETAEGFEAAEGQEVDETYQSGEGCDKGENDENDS